MNYDREALKARLTTAIPDGNIWLTNEEQAEKIMPVVDEMLEEIDRNARAFGWEIGRGNGEINSPIVAAPNNPFLNPHWRTKTNGEKKS